LNFNLPCSASYTYGKPKSTGAVPGLEGARDLEEYNKGLVVDQKIPNMLLLLSGASVLDQSDVDRVIEKLKEDNEQGHRGIAVLHAKPAPSITNAKSETPEITVIKTKSEQNNDALGLQYLERAYENTRRAYRVSRISLGDDKDLQRDIAMMARRIAEDETYDPRRVLFATRLNSTLLPDLGVYTLQYVCNSRTPKDPIELSSVLAKLAEHNILAPDEARQHASAILNTELPALTGAWAKLPSGLLTALLQTKNQLTAAAIMGNYDELYTKIQEAYQYLEGGTHEPYPSRPQGANPGQNPSTG
jgi:capsid portal protein